MGKLLIVTGMSGAGKTIALKSLEDMGYYCVDNLPIPLVDKFAELITDGNEQITKAALGIDVRSGKDLPLLKEIFDEWDIKGNVDYEVVFLDASDETLLKRFKETRRAHPLSKDGRVETGIEAERQEMNWLKENAGFIIDTTRLLTKELRAQLANIFEKNRAYENLQVTILSFGFKYGIPEDSDLLFDVRFLPNPYYVQELKTHTGLEQCIKDFVQKDGVADEFLTKLKDMVSFLIPHYIEEGKNQLVISIGCTGGKHRSVTIAELLYQSLSKSADYGIRIDHRDINK
ncbi:RNase adapter RapZ [Oribacterium sp. FC2011]|uniref:RNase adapter RapZ n=1 Tax=Oribacterium sp. FC2011 TaxID=1408311 RepID=UPI0004E17831|nr:RNase adapter RapZ [Oribacterium sp. FC2011]